MQVGNLILSTDEGPAWHAWDLLVQKPLHHVWSEWKSCKIAAFLVINKTFMVGEMAAVFASNSLELISDACHVLMHCAALGISLYPSYMVHLPTNGRFEFGYGCMEVLSALLVLIESLIVLKSTNAALESPKES